MRLLFVLGREPRLSLAELEAVFGAKNLQTLDEKLAILTVAEKSHFNPKIINRLGGTVKIAKVLEGSLGDFWKSLPKDKKLILGFSD